MKECIDSREHMTVLAVVMGSQIVIDHFEGVSIKIDLEVN